jgi:protein TonB
MALATQGSHVQHPDANRVAGYSVAIAFNALLLMLLLVPMQGPPSSTLVGENQPAINWYMPKPQQQTPPPQVPITKPQPPANAAVVPPTSFPQTPDQVVVDQGSELAVAPATKPDTTGTEVASIATPAQPLAGVRLEYAQAPAPSYPRSALRQRIEGTVLLEVLVDVDGRPLRVDVREGSGDRRLDAAAREQVRAHWRFRPAIRDGRAVQAIGLVPINFRLAP